MVDVVFLLLVFFMLAARFGAETAVPLAAGGAGSGAWEGPPRLVTIGADEVLLNGTPIEPARLAEALRPLMPAPDAPVVLRAREEASLQSVLDLAGALRAGGIETLALVP